MTKPDGNRLEKLVDETDVVEGCIVAECQEDEFIEFHGYIVSYLVISSLYEFQEMLNITADWGQLVPSFSHQ